VTDSWALKAIEEEADRRAMARIWSDASSLRVLGLTVQQIRWLRHDWMARTGKEPEEIPS